MKLPMESGQRLKSVKGPHRILTSEGEYAIGTNRCLEGAIPGRTLEDGR